MKYAWTTWLLLIAFGFLPPSTESLWTKIAEDDLIITAQECGCPCPEAKIMKGELDIPKEIGEQYPEIHRDQVNLAGNSPFAPYDYETAHAKIKINGEVVGADTVLCEPQSCEMTARFRVDSWTVVSYLPQFMTWNSTLMRAYLGFVVVGLVTLVILSFIRGKQKKVR